MNNNLHFSSATDKWNTPPDLVEDLATVFDFDLDVCASGPNVCENYYDEERNGLDEVWSGTCWMNPPYGREIGKWVFQAKRMTGNLENYPLLKVTDCIAVVCLVPARTDTRWWHDNVPQASQVVFIKGRLKFGGAKNSAPFPSAFVVFGEINNEQRAKLASYGISYTA